MSKFLNAIKVISVFLFLASILYIFYFSFYVDKQYPGSLFNSGSKIVGNQYFLEDANKILHEVTEEDWNTLKLCSNVFKVSLAYLILYLSFVCIRHSIYPNFKKLFLKLFRTRLV